MSAQLPVLDVVVPAYNEASRLPTTLPVLRTHLAALGIPAVVTVVDNASEDATAAIAASQPAGPVPVRVLHCADRGKGYAVRAGIVATDARYVGFCDADLATSLDQLPQVVQLLEQGHHVVVGSRAHTDSLVQARHRLARRWGAALFRRMVQQTVQSVGDTQCGYKFFESALARQVFRELGCGGFAFDVEVLARAELHGARIAEIPVTWIDVPGSTFSPIRDGWRSFADVAGISLRLRAEARAVARARAAEPVLPQPDGLPALGVGDVA
jgi:dolichyl-phosphate beta-glucosyltransferase